MIKNRLIIGLNGGIFVEGFVTFRDVSKIYKSGELEIPALHDVNFTVDKGEFCVIVGASGSTTGGSGVSIFVYTAVTVVAAVMSVVTSHAAV